MKLFSFLCLGLGIFLLAGCANEKAALARQQLRDAQTPFSQQAFIQSIVDGDNNKVDLFLTGGMDTKIGQHNSNALIIAVESNHPEIAEMLLNHGAEIDPPGFAGSPLCVAAAKNYINIAELLIARKANVNYLQGSQNPLLMATDAGNQDMVKLLLDSRADYDIQGESTKFSPLMLAARKGHTEIVKMLLGKGADSQLVDHAGKTALLHAIFSGKTETAEVFLADKSYEPEKNAVPALIMAFSMSRIPIAQKIIEHGADLNAKMGDLPLLSWAIKNNYEDGAEMLIKSGADLHEADSDNMIPLDYALAAKNDKIVKLLRSAKAENTQSQP